MIRLSFLIGFLMTVVTTSHAAVDGVFYSKPMGASITSLTTTINANKPCSTALAVQYYENGGLACSSNFTYTSSTTALTLGSATMTFGTNFNINTTGGQGVFIFNGGGHRVAFSGSTTPLRVNGAALIGSSYSVSTQPNASATLHVVGEGSILGTCTTSMTCDANTIGKECWSTVQRTKAYCSSAGNWTRMTSNTTLVSASAL